MQVPALTQPQPAPGHPSPEAYLALEDTAEHRSEYINGVILPMAGSRFYP